MSISTWKAATSSLRTTCWSQIATRRCSLCLRQTSLGSTTLRLILPRKTLSLCLSRNHLAPLEQRKALPIDLNSAWLPPILITPVGYKLKRAKGMIKVKMWSRLKIPSNKIWLFPKLKNRKWKTSTLLSKLQNNRRKRGLWSKLKLSWTGLET